MENISQTSNNNNCSSSCKIETETKNKDDQAVIAIVDAFSTGELLALELKEQGAQVVFVYSKLKEDGGVFCNDFDPEEETEIFVTKDLQDVADQLVQLGVHYILPGAETGVTVADQLAHLVGLEFRNPLELSEARRSKFVQQETIRAAGIPAAKQILASEWNQIQSFLKNWEGKVIVKPNQSAGSDDVFLCDNPESVKEAFECINGKINGCGEVNEGVLVMEFLEGEEYVVDSVTLNGTHKVVSIWKYDKRAANGKFNVYFGMESVVVASDLEERLVNYSQKVLDALQIHNGPSHMEIIVTKEGPRLVEVGSRLHGGHGTWRQMANAAFGYNQVTATVAALLDQEFFHQLPPFPSTPRMVSKEVFLVSYRTGVVRDMPGVHIAQSLPSYNAKDIGISHGRELTPTVDLFNCPGRLQLIHECKDQVAQDFQRIHDMLATGSFFELVSTVKELQAIQQDCPQEE